MFYGMKECFMEKKLGKDRLMKGIMQEEMKELSKERMKEEREEGEEERFQCKGKREGMEGGMNKERRELSPLSYILSFLLSLFPYRLH